MKKWRKYFNSPSKKENQLIAQDCDKLNALAENISKEHDKEEDERQKRTNYTCPLCKKSDIVNKITRVEGRGSISGNMFGIYGSSQTDTNEVNHCNSCGNQWKKYEKNT